MRVLFLCSRNRLRSPTAEQVFSSWRGVEVESAGLSSDADTPLTSELVEWSELIFVMEDKHRAKLSKEFRRYLKQQRVICLGIPDRYTFMQPELVDLLVGEGRALPSPLSAGEEDRSFTSPSVGHPVRFWPPLFPRKHVDSPLSDRCLGPVRRGRRSTSSRDSH